MAEVGELAVEVGCRGEIGDELPDLATATMFAFTVAPVDRDLRMRAESLKNIFPLVPTVLS